MEKQRNVFQIKEENKTSETDLNKTYINYLSNRKLKIMAVEIATKVWRAIHEHSKNFNKEMKYI